MKEPQTTRSMALKEKCPNPTGSTLLRRSSWRLGCFLSVFISLAGMGNAQEHALNLSITDIHGKPIPAVHITFVGANKEAVTDEAGRGHLALPPQITPGSEIELQVKSADRDLVFISPWNRRVLVPALENEQNVEVVLAERGERTLLLDSRAMKALITAILQRSTPKASTEEITPRQRRADLESVANEFGLAAKEVDEALRLWAKRTSDPYERGLAALYSSRFLEAAELLELSAKQQMEELAATYGHLGEALFEQGKYQEAITAFRRALDLAPGDATVLSKLGKVLTKLGNYDEAGAALGAALAITGKTLGVDHPNYGAILNDLAELHELQGKYREAEKEYRQALAIREKLGPDHPAVANSYDRLGRLYFLQGKYVEASVFYRLALSIREKSLGAEHPDVVTSLSNLADLYYAQGNYDEAEPLFRRVLGIRERALGPEHPDVAVTLNSLGVLYSSQARYTEAEVLLRRSLKIREKSLDQEHPDTAASYNNLGLLYENQGRYAEAEVLFTRSLTIAEKVLGPEHPDVATSLNNLGSVYIEEAKYAEAEVLFKRSLAILSKALGPEHRDVAYSLTNLGLVYMAQKKYKAAEAALKSSQTIMLQVLGPDHPMIASLLSNLGELYASQGMYAQAEPLLRQALAIYEKTLGPEHPGKAGLFFALARLYTDQERYAEAEKLFKGGLEIAEKYFGPESGYIAPALEDYSMLLEKMNRNDEAAILRERAKRIREGSTQTNSKEN